jgi:hypothetical protein
MSPATLRLLSVILLLTAVSTARAVIINSEWNTGNGFWNVAANWAPVDVPDNASGRNHHVKIGNRAVANGAVVTFITEDGNFDIVTTMAISNGAEWFSNSWHLEVFGLTTVDGAGSKIRIGPHENHHAEAFRSFDMTVSDGGAFLLNDAAVTIDHTLDITANSTLEGPGEIIGDDVFFRSASIVMTEGMLHLEVGATHVEAGAVFSGEGGLHISAGGNLLLADGTDVHLMMENHGTLVIGAGTPANAGGHHYHQDAEGQWNVDIFGATADEYDHLDLHHDADLAGALQLTLGGGYVPTLGDTYDILTTEGSVAGEFSTMTQPAGLPAGVKFDIEYLADKVQLIVVNSLTGDYNRDGIVDAADFVVWKKMFDQTVPRYTSADGDGDGSVDEDDYAVWLDNFGRTAEVGSGGSASASAPEPALPLLVILAVFGGRCGLRLRRR